MTPEGRALCAELRARIVRLGWSETARRSGIDRTNLYRAFPAKRGESSLNFTTLTKVAAVFGLQVAALPADINQSSAE